jgi:hypothetical protein
MGIGKAEEIYMCGKLLSKGDFVKVMYTAGTWSKGGTISGNIVELWDEPDILQARVSNGWCFHDYDEILEHKPHWQR